MAGGEREDKKQDSQHVKNWWKKLLKHCLTSFNRKSTKKNYLRKRWDPGFKSLGNGKFKPLFLHIKYNSR